MSKRPKASPVEPSLHSLANLARQAAHDFVPEQASEQIEQASEQIEQASDATMEQASPLTLSKLAMQVADELNQHQSDAETRPKQIEPIAEEATPAAPSKIEPAEVEQPLAVARSNPEAQLISEGGQTEAPQVASQIEQLNEFAQAFQLDEVEDITPVISQESANAQQHSFADDDALLQLITCVDAIKSRHSNDPKLSMLCEIMEYMVKKLSEELSAR